jgi:hypothetical protein
MKGSSVAGSNHMSSTAGVCSLFARPAEVIVDAVAKFLSDGVVIGSSKFSFYGSCCARLKP